MCSQGEESNRRSFALDFVEKDIQAPAIGFDKFQPISTVSPEPSHRYPHSRRCSAFGKTLNPAVSDVSARKLLHSLHSFHSFHSAPIFAQSGLFVFYRGSFLLDQCTAIGRQLLENTPLKAVASQRLSHRIDSQET